MEQKGSKNYNNQIDIQPRKNKNKVERKRKRN